MNNIERRDRQILYISDEEIFEEQKKCRAILQKLNFMDRADFEGISVLVKELFGSSDGAFLNPPFYCDYGSHIHVGRNFFANYNCTIIDVAPVTIGDNCQMAPNVAIYTAGHPVHPATRNTAYEYGIEVTIGNNVWIGGNTVILPGVHIGDNAVIGAGSVVTKDIPAWCVAAGNPCKVIREITEEDREYYFRHIPVDQEARTHMEQMWSESDDPIRYPSLGKKYRFYGWKTANVKDFQGRTPRDYYDLLTGIWSADTCAPRMRDQWTPENRTWGQCSVTAFLIQDIFGGKVQGVQLKDGSVHCFNDVDGCVFDLTSEQFGDEKLNYENCTEQDRSVHFANVEKRQRYEKLKERLTKAVGEQ